MLICHHQIYETMAKLTIDDIEFESDNLSDSGRNLLASIQFIRTEMARLDNQLKVNKAAELFYAQQLKDEVQKGDDQEKK